MASTEGNKIRTFDTGATRDQDQTKPDYEGYLSPLVIKRFGEYMTKHRVQADGTLRDSDNWQKGIPLDAYMKSGFRHFMDWWTAHRGGTPAEPVEEALCALFFNVQGYLHETLKKPTRAATPLATFYSGLSEKHAERVFTSQDVIYPPAMKEPLGTWLKLLVAKVSKQYSEGVFLSADPFQPIGWLIFEEDKGRLYIYDMAVLPQFQKSGFGRGMVERAFQRAREDARSIEYHCRTESRRLLCDWELMKKLGYIPSKIKFLKGYYAEAYEDQSLANEDAVHVVLEPI